MFLHYLRSEDPRYRQIESAWSLFKRSVVRTYHQLSAEHLPSYRDEMAFRLHNRENLCLFRDTLMMAFLGSETLLCRQLTS